MNKTIVVWLVLAACVALLAVSARVEAARMGSGKSMGKQNSAVKHSVTKPAAQPTQNAVPAKPQAAPTPAAVAAPAVRPWGAVLGGMAAGLGLAWLANSLGIGEAVGNILMAVVLGGLVLAIAAWLIRRRQQAKEPQPNFGADHVV